MEYDRNESSLTIASAQTSDTAGAVKWPVYGTAYLARCRERVKRQVPIYGQEGRAPVTMSCIR